MVMLLFLLIKVLYSKLSNLYLFAETGIYSMYGCGIFVADSENLQQVKK